MHILKINNPLIRWHMIQRVGVHFVGVVVALTKNPKKVCTFKLKINNEVHLSN